jgi:hypothetical protein
MLNRIRQLLGRAVPLEFALEGRTVRFRTPDEFAVALRPRTEVTAAFVRLRTCGDTAKLRHEFDQTRRLQRRLTDLLIWAFETGEQVHDAWREAEAVDFADEHQWRSIMRSLADRRDVDERFRRVALAKFLRYLESRRTAIELAIEREEHAGGTREMLMEPLDAQAQPAVPAVEGQEGNEELTYTSARHSSVFKRLPPHKAVDIVLGAGDGVPMFLAHRRLRLAATPRGWVLKDEKGLEIALHEGRMIVGRADDCDIVLRDAPPDVSRHHLAIECHADHIRLVDLSTQGTYLPKRALMETAQHH